MATRTSALILWSTRPVGWSDLRRSLTQPSVAATFLSLVAVGLSVLASAGVPVTGDAALHTSLASQISDSWSLDTDPASHYPPLFHVLGAMFYAAAGITGLHLLSALALGATGAVTYLIARQLGMGPAPSLAAQALVSLSPVMLWYSGLILMEPTLVAAVMLSVLLTLRFNEHPTIQRGVALVLALVTMLLVKQTAAPVAVAVVVFLALSGRVGVKKSSAVAAATLLLIALPYLWVYDNTGALIDLGQPPLTEVEADSSTFPGSLIAGGWVAKQPEWSLALEQEVDSSALYRQGTQVHESRHIWAVNLISWQNFSRLHTPYPAAFSGYNLGQFWPTTIFGSVGLMLGFGALTFAVRRRSDWTLLALVMVISYFAMYFGSDTKRLYLFVTALSVLIIIFGYETAWKWLRRRTGNSPRFNRFSIAVTVGVAALLLVSALPQLRAQFQVLDNRETTQGGGFASVGGVESIAEIGAWINQNTEPGQGFVAASVYEWEYYSDRQDLWDDGLDYRLYFLSPDRIQHYLMTAGAKYVVIRTNQIVEDDEWNHIERVPQQFVTAIEEMFPMVQQSVTADIRVYEVTTQQQG